MEGIIILIIICIIGYLSFLYSKHTNKNATKGNLSSTTVIYLNGCLGYQSGVEVKIQSNPNQITIDEKYYILVQKISNVHLTKTKQLTEEQKNVIGRAVIGTLVAGSLGGIVGGISGVGSTKRTEDIEILSIDYKDNNEIKQTISFIWKDVEEKSVVLNSWANGIINKTKENRI